MKTPITIPKYNHLFDFHIARTHHYHHHQARFGITANAFPKTTTWFTTIRRQTAPETARQTHLETWVSTDDKDKLLLTYTLHRRSCGETARHPATSLLCQFSTAGEVNRTNGLKGLDQVICFTVKLLKQDPFRPVCALCCWDAITCL